MSFLIVKIRGEFDMKYGYARVSTRGQASKGNSLDDQRQQLMSAGADEVIEEQYTITTIKRPA